MSALGIRVVELGPSQVAWFVMGSWSGFLSKGYFMGEFNASGLRVLVKRIPVVVWGGMNVYASS